MEHSGAQPTTSGGQSEPWPSGPLLIAESHWCHSGPRGPFGNVRGHFGQHTWERRGATGIQWLESRFAAQHATGHCPATVSLGPSGQPGISNSCWARRAEEQTHQSKRWEPSRSAPRQVPTLRTFDVFLWEKKERKKHTIILKFKAMTEKEST